jgi:hypothetical protein
MADATVAQNKTLATIADSACFPFMVIPPV